MYFAKHKFPKYLIFSVLLTICTNSVWANIETNLPKNSNLMNNSAFWILGLLAVILLLFIGAVGRAIKNIATTTVSYPANKNQSTTRILGLIIAMGLCCTPFVQAQETAETTAAVSGLTGDFQALNTGVFWVLLSAVIFEAFILLVLLRILQKLVRTASALKGVTEEKSLFDLATFVSAMNASVPVERENDVMTEHVYDGIRELDNDLPPWWKYGFYLTIVVSIIYFIGYHVTQSFPLQLEEYNKELADAKIAKEAYLKNAGEQLDENNVTSISDPSALDLGKNLYKEKCIACHGAIGEGGVGPNLTDEYWLHGGGIKNIFKSIKYGIPAKGMIAWQGQLKPVEMQQISSYILSLKGTNPPGAKESQGDKYSGD